MHDGIPSSRDRPPFLSGWFRRAATVAIQDRSHPGGLYGSSRAEKSEPAADLPGLLFISPVAEDRDAFPARVHAAFGQVEVVTRTMMAPLVRDDSAMAAIIVDCREDHDAIMRILGEFDLLGASTRPLMTLLIRPNKADKAWAIAIGADNVLLDPFDDADLVFLLRASGQSAVLHRENAKLRLSLDEASRDAHGLRTLAYTDHLTGLPNRLYLVNWLNELIARHDADLHFAVHMLDLDGFKHVNDQYGHRAGDDILKQVAKRVTQICRKLDLVVRLGGDEIVIVQAGVVSREDCQAFTARVWQTFQKPFLVDETETILGASIGSALYPGDGGSVSELLHHADLAMYAAKPPGAERDPPAGGDPSARLVAARRDMDGGHYAPVFTLTSASLGGVLCVPDPENDDVADTAGLRLLRLACLQSAFRSADQHDAFFAAPVGPDVLARDDVVSRLRDLLTDTDAEPDRCEIMVAASDLDREPELWHQLRELGYGLGVLVETEDFSPQRLLRVPLTRLHLGASFLGSGSATSEPRVLIDLAVMFARAVYAETLARGVTSAEQLERLRDAGVGCASGPLAGAPIRGSDLSPLWRRAFHGRTIDDGTDRRTTASP